MMVTLEKHRVLSDEVNESIDDSSDRREKVSVLFSHLINFMKIFGILSIRRNGSHFYGKAIGWLHECYCITIQLVVLGNAIRSVLAFTDNKTHWQYHIAVISFAWTNCVFSSIGFVIYYSSKRITSFLKAFDQYRTDFGIYIKVEKIKKIMFIVTIIAMTQVLVTTATLVVGFHVGWMSKTSIFAMLLWPLHMSNHPLFLVMTLSYGIVTHYVYAGCIILVLFYFFVLHCIKKEFAYISKRLVKLGQDKSDAIVTEFEDIRQQHQAIGNLLITINPTLQHVAGGYYAMGIPVICLMVNGLFSGSILFEDFYKIIIIIFGNLIGMFAITFQGAAVSSEAHRPLIVLHDYDLTSLPDKVIHQIAMFANRLTGPAIGVDVYGLFVIDGSTILMIFGTIITYAVIAIEFSSPSRECSSKLPLNITNLTIS